jgi:hypothetical protein
MFESDLEKIEARALSCMRNICPMNGGYHDYANIVRKVEKAALAVDKAMRTLYKTEAELIEIADKQ